MTETRNWSKRDNGEYKTIKRSTENGEKLGSSRNEKRKRGIIKKTKIKSLKKMNRKSL